MMLKESSRISAESSKNLQFFLLLLCNFKGIAGAYFLKRFRKDQRCRKDTKHQDFLVAVTFLN